MSELGALDPQEVSLVASQACLRNFIKLSYFLSEIKVYDSHEKIFTLVQNQKVESKERLNLLGLKGFYKRKFPDKDSTVESEGPCRDESQQSREGAIHEGPSKLKSYQ